MQLKMARCGGLRQGRSIVNDSKTHGRIVLLGLSARRLTKCHVVARVVVLRLSFGKSEGSEYHTSSWLKRRSLPSLELACGITLEPIS
jgi:hypothetical protein